MLAQFKIGVRLVVGFALLIVLMAVMAFVSVNQLGRLEQQINIIVNDRVVKVLMAEQIAKNTYDMARQIRNLVLKDSPTDRAAIKETIGGLRNANAEILEKLDKILDTDAGRSIVEKIKDTRSQLVPLYTRLFEIVDKDPAAARQLVLVDFTRTNNQLIAAANDLVKLQKDLIAKQQKTAGETYESARNTVVGLVILATLLSCAAAWLIVNSITGPLKEIQKSVLTVRDNNDFTVTVPVRGKDEVSLTGQAFNELMQTLRQTFSGLRTDIVGVAQASEGLVHAAGQSASASALSSESASAMAAAVEEMTVSINQVSENASAASSLAEQAGHQSDQGGTVIAETVGEMQMIADAIDRVSAAIANLGERSNQISSVTQVIKDVADQTNLLALNAAIEAARAGEAGRGFAVVADEVRKLAERTTKATGEISEMIGGIQTSAASTLDAMRDTVTQVRNGRDLAERAGTAIVEIRRSANEVVAVVSDIASSIAEQSSASQAIAQKLEAVAQAAEENNATAEETAQSAKELGALAVNMRTTTERFRV